MPMQEIKYQIDIISTSLHLFTATSEINTTLSFDTKNYPLGVTFIPVVVTDGGLNAVSLIKLEHSDTSNGTYSDVPTQNIVGDILEFDNLGSESQIKGVETVYKTLGILGTKRFVRLVYQAENAVTVDISIATFITANQDVLPGAN